MGLTDKQKLFIDYKIELGEATKAARKAGYSEGSVQDAPNWLNPRKPQYKPYLVEAINARLEELKNERTADLQELLEFHTGIMRGLVTEEVINPVTGKHEKMPAALSVRQKSADAILRHYGRVPNNLLVEEQELKNQKIKAEIETIKLDTSNDTDDVIIVDDWSEVGEDAEGET